MFDFRFFKKIPMQTFIIWGPYQVERKAYIKSSFLHIRNAYIALMTPTKHYIVQKRIEAEPEPSDEDMSQMGCCSLAGRESQL